ncbi:Six-hairpin glycosidase-like protein [Aspergillus pseudonomiae]|uniref:Six-hairpin glycosidase-like protein n=1 Tax=Aspergillus pseudonomiae TaxID=1506151 RepID=A0A5N6IC72_9EURO|nr:Six-hairpin glycosidase-like protein [Aspergillus pseudonomiae]KAB8263657.1 Six-hairpin glycosidase-like protein [Aspergillus pseudonomiae]KAE8408522.1 Six-hairpin glycosidase-like protein [Aspergillus pseudonomiae]
MRVNRYAALWGLLHVVGGSADGSPASLPSYTAKTYTISEGTPMAFDEGTVIKLSSDGTSPSIVVLDYGRNVEGYATFNVSKRSGDTSAFEMTYSETRALLDSDMGDGPLPLAAAMDTYRVNRYNITEQKTYSNRLIQGGLRYQKLNLSSAGEVELASIGFKPTVSSTPVTALPGSFNCSDPVLNRIWQVGARTTQLTEIPAKSLPDFWVITDEGAFIDSLAPQPFNADFATAMTAYNLEFSVKPVTNGFGFTVLSDTLGNGVYIFVNVANFSISAHVGSTERSEPIASASLPSNITLDTWHLVHSKVQVPRISVQIDGVTVLNFSQSATFYGSFGLGASLGHSAVFTNVALRAFGQDMYNSPLNDSSALEGFLLGTNPLPVSVDGSRRDRIAYTGDLDMATGTTFASTYGHEYINGSIELLGSFQMPPGFFVPTAKVQQAPRTTEINANITGLIGYSFSIVSAMARFYEQTGDVGFLTHWAPKTARMLDWAHSQTLPNGLFNVSNSALGGDWNYYDPALDGVVSKFNLIYAYALKQWLPFMDDAGLNTTLYAGRLHNLQDAINKHLWSDTLQAYYMSDSHRNFLSQEANALAVLTDTATSGNQTWKTVLSTMARELYVPPGALAFSNKSVESGWAQKISPYASGYHLKAAFHVNDSANAKYLLHSIWGPMSDPSHTNYTGCMWEVLAADGTPGLGSSTSLCHVWSSGPTADLSRYVLGVQPVTPGFKEWKVVPQSLDLEWTKGAYPVPGGRINVDWSFDSNDLLHMTVTAPNGTKGTVYLPSPLKKTLHKYNATGFLSDEKDYFTVEDGEIFSIHQTD